jgi:hypothetical protein
MDGLDAQRLTTDLVDGVMCDGFDGYFFNSDDDPAQALRALEAIGAVRTAAIVRRAFARFPGGTPPSDRLERQTTLLDVVNPADDDLNVFEPEDNDFFAYPENVEELAAAYLRAQDPQ